MGLFGGKKKRRKKRVAPKLEAVQATAPAAVQATAPAAVAPAESAPAVQIANPNIKPQAVASIDPEAEKSVPDLDSGKWRKKSSKPLLNIQRKVDRINNEDTLSLEERYEKAFGERLPQDTKYVKEKKKDENAITFKPKTKVSFKPKIETKKVTKDSKNKKEESADEKEESKGILGRMTGTMKVGGSKAGSILGAGTDMTTSAIGAPGRKTKSMFGFAGSAIGSGAAMVKSGVTSGASKVTGAVSDYRSGGKSTDNEKSTDYNKMNVKELKEELKKRGLKTSGKKPDLIARLNE